MSNCNLKISCFCKRKHHDTLHFPKRNFFKANCVSDQNKKGKLQASGGFKAMESNKNKNTEFNFASEL